MKKLKNSFIFGLVMLVTLSFCIVASVVSKHTPDPVSIACEEDLKLINNDLNGYYIIKNDIVIEKGIEQIGSSEKPFTGTLIGTNRTISNFHFKNTTENCGLFCNNKGIIYGLTVELSNCLFPVENSDLKFGILSYENQGKITNCTIRAKESVEIVSDSIKGGGICYSNLGEIRKCLVSANIHCTSKINDCSYGSFCYSMSSGIIELSKSTGWPSVKTSGINSNAYISSFAINISGGMLKNCFSEFNPIIESKNESFCAGFCITASNCSFIDCCSKKGSDLYTCLNLEHEGYFYVSSYICECISNVSITNCLSMIKIYSQCDTLYANFILFNRGLKDYKNCIFCNESNYIKSLDDVGSYKKTEDLSNSLMHWDRTVWRIEKGIISFIL